MPPCHVRPLNEGRSVNPGDTVSHPRPAFRRAWLTAQRRPERQPRLHVRWPCRPSRVLWRPLNEGRSVNPGYTTRCTILDPHFGARLRSTKAGASTPATHAHLARPGNTPRSCFAQRRPERQPRLHLRTSLVTGVWYDAQRRPERQPRLHERAQVFAAHRFASAQRRPERQPRLHHPLTMRHRMRRDPAALNEGRSVNPGYTQNMPPVTLAM